MLLPSTCTALAEAGKRQKTSVSKKKTRTTMKKQEGVPGATSPVNQRCLVLVSRLKNKFHKIVCDNYFPSPNFFCRLRDLNQLAMGTFRPSYGVPSCVLQKEVTKKKRDELKIRGRTLVAVHLEKKLVACSVYDSKPVNFLSSDRSLPLGRTTRTKKVFNYEAERRIPIPIDCITYQSFYNSNMNGVDRHDHARTNYRVDGKWNREERWWKVHLNFIIDAAATNSYFIHKALCDEGQLKPLSHKQFRDWLAGQLLFGEFTPPRVGDVLLPKSRKVADRLDRGQGEYIPRPLLPLPIREEKRRRKWGRRRRRVGQKRRSPPHLNIALSSLLLTMGPVTESGE